MKFTINVIFIIIFGCNLYSLTPKNFKFPYIIFLEDSTTYQLKNLKLINKKYEVEFNVIFNSDSTFKNLKINTIMYYNYKDKYYNQITNKNTLKSVKKELINVFKQRNILICFQRFKPNQKNSTFQIDYYLTNEDNFKKYKYFCN